MTGVLVGAWFSTSPRAICGRPGQSHAQVAQAEIATIGNQVLLYLLDNGYTQVPAGFSLGVLTEGPNPYLLASDLSDPWGNQYVIVPSKMAVSRFMIMTMGADGKTGGVGDNADVWSPPLDTNPQPISGWWRR